MAHETIYGQEAKRKGEMIERHNRNYEIIMQLKRYLPEGCVQDEDPVPVRGSGCRYQDGNGKEYLDFSSGIFTNTFGHACEEINRAGYAQAGLLANVHGRHTEAELRFYQRLFPLLPADDYKAMPYNDGGYTIDRGLTDIVNYYGRKRIGIGAYRNGFHGKTQAAKLLVNETKKASFYHNFLIDFPNCYRCPWKKRKGQCHMECAKSAVQELEANEAGAVIFELIQGSGIVLPPEGYWERIYDYCKSHGILMFADEVLTGGGRTGSYLASSHYGVIPDMIAITKGLANGKPLSVLLERSFITQNPYAVRPLERASTFAAHPEALAAAEKLLELLERDHIMENVRILGAVLKDKLLEIAEKSRFIGEIRSLGLMAAVEFVTDKESKLPSAVMGTAVFQSCRENGLETIQSGHIIRLAPPLNMKRDELLLGLSLLEESIEQAEEEAAVRM